MGAARDGFVGCGPPSRARELSVRDQHSPSRPVEARETGDVAQTRCGDGHQVQPGLPRWKDLSELVAESSRTRPCVDEDGPFRASKEDGLPVADGEHAHLCRRIRPHAEGCAGDQCRSRNGAGQCE